MVFQQFNLWPHMTVQENVAAPLVLGKKMSRQAAKAAAMAALDRVGMAQKADDWPVRLSGGQQQRTGIARALALNPELLLLDEPTSALDPERVEEVLDVIRSLAGQGMTMVMVTHEMAFAAHISSRLVFMADGHILESGTPRQMFTQPKSERLKNFLAPLFRRPASRRTGEVTMMETSLQVARQLDEDWLNHLLAQLAEFGKLADGGVDRQALSEVELDARAWLIDLARELGCEIYRDAAANLFSVVRDD
jgi:ABC-type methionine transport system ATPase subunit